MHRFYLKKNKKQKHILKRLGESPYPGYKPRQVADLLQTGYRMPRPRHISEEL